MRKTQKPLVRDNLLLLSDRESGPGFQVLLETPPWQDWLTENTSFVFEAGAGHLTARREIRRGIAYWYAYRRRDGKLLKTYLGRSQELTQARLEQATRRLAGQVPITLAQGQAEMGGLLPSPVEGHSAERREADMSLFPVTKVTPPALPDKLIARPRLTQRITTPVTIVCAPSGFGKSTVLNEWQLSSGMPVAWVSLDADDNRPLRFWAKVVRALQTVEPSLAENWSSQLYVSSAPDLSRIVVNLTNDIVRVTSRPNALQRLGLILDNYHYIWNSEIHTSLQTWLEHIPPALNLAIAGNSQPPLALGYLKARGMVVELRGDDLRLTMQEGIAFLQQHIPGQPLAYGEMQALVKRTEGWITGLVLATCALAQQGDRSRFVEAFSGAHAVLREFFIGNVFQRQPPEVQSFLLKTSILRHVGGPLCDAVTGQNNGAEMLAWLLRENLFLEHLEEPGWYRYQDLFAEALRAHLQSQFPSETARLHRRAGKWYRAQNDGIDAVDHLLAARSWEEAASLIESVVLRELEPSGESSRLWQWLQQLPEWVVQQHKVLLIAYVRLAWLGLPTREVDDFLSRAEMRIASMPASQKTSALRAALAESRRARHLWSPNDHAMTGLPSGGDHESVGQMLDGILKCHRDCRVNLIKAEAEANKVYQTALARNQLFSILMAGGECANLAFSQGQLRRSEQIAYQVLRQAGGLRDNLPESAGFALTALSGIYFERNQTARAQQLLERAIEVDPNPIRANELMAKEILRAKLQSIQGDTDAALVTIEAVREFCSNRSPSIWLDQDLSAYQALFHLHQGDDAVAERVLGEGWDVDEYPFSAFIRASILMDQDRNVAAEEILRHLLNRYPSGFYWVPILRVRVKLAVALFNQQKMNQARQVMAEAARLAAPEFFVRPFLSTEPQIPVLLSLVLHTEDLQSGTRSFVKGTLTTLGHAAETLRTSGRSESLSLAVAASISPREQEVLRLLSAGLSNREIAARFVISDSTVKTHLESIYRKLGVSSRTQAIAQAHALNLL